MKLPAPVSIKWIASLIDAELLGNENAEVTGINEIHSVEKGDIVFVDHPKYYNKCLASAASFIIINKRKEKKIPIRSADAAPPSSSPNPSRRVV